MAYPMFKQLKKAIEELDPSAKPVAAVCVWIEEDKEKDSLAFLITGNDDHDSLIRMAALLNRQASQLMYVAGAKVGIEKGGKL